MNGGDCAVGTARCSHRKNKMSSITLGPKLFVAEIAPSHKKTVNLIDFPVPNPTKIVIGGDKTLGPRVVRSKRIAPFYYFPCGVTVTDSTRIVNGGDGGAGTASSA